MRQKIILLALFLFTTSAFSIVRAQTADVGIKVNYAGGEVASVASGKIVLQTKDGAIDVVLSEKTEYKRVSPEKPSLQTATQAAFADIGVGDKILVTGMVASDKKSLPAKAVYLLTKSDITQKQIKDREQWRTRGITGQVAAINPQMKEITVSSRGMTGETKMILTPKDTAVFRRYAQNSNSYNEAKISSIDEIKVGDSIRALGDKSADGASYQADEILSGSFQTIGGTITAIDAAKNEITITNIQTKKPVTIVVGANSILKQFPAEMAQRMAAFQTGGMQPPTGIRPPTPPPTPTNAQGGQTAPNGARQGGGMRGGIDEMLERFKTITLADLKVGDMIAFSSTKTANQDRVTAIKLLSGVEPFLKAPQAANNIGGGGRRGADSGFSIPGLEGGAQ